MFKNYLKVALRNLSRHKAFSIINIVGLALGIAISLTIFLWIQDELSYDDFHEKGDRIYRLTVSGSLGKEQFNTINTAAPTARVIANTLPDVRLSTRILKGWQKQVSYKDRIFSEDYFQYADSNFFQLFSFPLLEGDPEKVLRKPNSVVITQTTASRYFDQENPIGKELISDEGRNYIVTGVCKDVPNNSHFHFDLIASLNTFDWISDNNWLQQYFATYFVVKPGCNINNLKEKIQTLAMQYIGPQLEEFLGFTVDEFDSAGNKYEFSLQALRDIHLHSNLEAEFEQNGNFSFVLVFSIIAIFILFMACINFMNLTTSRSAARTREIGIRKALGSSRKQLIVQFLTESIGMTLLALILAFAIMEIILPHFNELAEKNLVFQPFSKWLHAPVFFLLILIIGLLSGSYPAYFLSSFSPLSVLSGKIRQRIKKSYMRSGLVLFQFAISITLIISTINIFNQLRFIDQKDIGISKNHIMVIEHAYSLRGKKEEFKNRIKQHKSILDATTSFTLPGDRFSSSSHHLEGTPEDELHLMHWIHVDYDFISTMDVRLKRGRFFSKNVPGDTLSILLNEAAVKDFGLDNPIGKKVNRPSGDEGMTQKFTVIGVVEDFNYESLHRDVRPLVINLLNEDDYARFIAVKIKAKDKAECIKHIEKEWVDMAHGQAFLYFFLDSYLDRLYKEDKQTGQLFFIFSMLAIFIALLGLYGLSTFITGQRTKEIGIRKVLGASEISIVLMLWKDFSRWVLLANLIAWPLAWVFLDHWLKNFAFNVEISLVSFPLVAIATLVIALLTISVQSVQSALSNPVEALKYE
ncbi:MAG: ABC transporter permease [Bacteroidales bacterium]|nr:ABC transporter permease [Bacteroidales bacterium]MCF8454559.1 ABC transporter permease [Bacteroidales bacterium]